MQTWDSHIWVPVGLRPSPSAGKQLVLNKSLLMKFHLSSWVKDEDLWARKGREGTLEEVSHLAGCLRGSSAREQRCVFGLPEKELGGREGFGCHLL